MQKTAMRLWMVLGLMAVFLAACSVYGPDYSSFLNEAHSRNVPILIYKTSWNDPRGGGRLAVWVANLQDKRIDSIQLQVAPCGAKGDVQDATPLVLGGPFFGHTAYVSLPSWPIDAHYYPGAGLVYADQAVSSGHMIIKSVLISYADGKQDNYDDNVAELLTKNISNYCANLTPDSL
ncbi:MAG TPA: hypothetical protein VNI53_08135 [Gammaproteobacteria bacterium]|nr:hypothetical protein [Gammaproteobacteria bacterium]